MNSSILDFVALTLMFEGIMLASGFNIDVDFVRSFNGPPGSLFGLSVLGHQVDGRNWILVGAPNSRSQCQSQLSGPPGALFKCSLWIQEGESCTQVCLDNKGNERYYYSPRRVEDKKDGQFLGVSLTSQPGTGKVVVCGHLWINQRNAIDRPNDIRYILQFANGICYSVNARLETQSVEKIRPCITESGNNWILCLSGASAQFAVDGKTLMLGAPGASFNRGTIITMNGTEIRHIQPSVWNYDIQNHQYPYIGYSLTSGHFSSPSAVEGVTGGPRFRDVGQVYIFDLHQFTVIKELTGEPVNTYFGASVEAVDLNGDEWSDLLVGAPLYSTNQDEGCVYVYINDGLGEFELPVKIKGSNAIGARFGSAIKSLGDLNKDGYTDVAIGAPYEDEMTGAVYIYHGARQGIDQKYSQRIPGKTFGLTSFGSSLSGNLDLDSNGYPDLVVGAHQADSVMYLRTRPVINIQATMTVSPTTLAMRDASAVNTQPTTITVYICLIYSGINVGESNKVVYTLQADYQVASILQSSRVYFGSSVSASAIEGSITLQHSVQQCRTYLLTLKNFVKDFLNPIPVRLSYHLENNTSSMAAVLNPAVLNSITKEIGFGRNCGADGICEADLQLYNTHNLLSGRDVIYLGADSILHINVKISNLGEEAHQARLIITHPANVVYEAVKTIMSTEAINVKCEPVSADNVAMPYIECIVGNPLRSNAEVLLQVQLDIGSLKPGQTELNVSLSVSTSSNEMVLVDNEALVSIPIEILADITMKGASNPEQLVYKEDADYTSATYLKDILEVVSSLSVGTEDGRVLAEDGPRVSDGNGVMVGQEDQGVIYTNANTTMVMPPEQGPGPDDTMSLEPPSVNTTVIGPEFVQQFEVANLGPGRVPYGSTVNITIPWRAKEGDWLVFITQVTGIDGVDACNTASVLKQQYQDILHYYNVSSAAMEDGSMKYSDSEKTGSSRTTFDCVTAQCVTLQCNIQPIARAASAVIELRARLWKQSFLKASYGVVVMETRTSVSVKNPQGLFTQPATHSPDNGVVKLTVSAEVIKSTELPIPTFVIPVSIIAGILLLIIAVVIMSKLGFFHRGHFEEMRRRRAEEANQQDKLVQEEPNDSEKKEEI